MKRKTAYVLAALLLLSAAAVPSTGAAKETGWPDKVKALVRDGSVLVTDPAGNVVLSQNPKKLLMPASTLKVATCAAALETLGPDYRFTTECRLSREGDLYVVGRGDPYLISEELAGLARTLRDKGLQTVRNILLDDSFFQPGLVLDGTARSLQPYDAYNGALCVNFNTIYARINPKGEVESAEPQTPLTDLARELALKSKKKGEVRFNLAESPETCLLYAGDLIKAFLQLAGVQVAGQVRRTPKDPAEVPPFYLHRSSKPLSWLIGQLMEYSNNFMTNQIFLTMGAEKFGPPADPDKSRRVMEDFFQATGIPPFRLEEGSGLSRQTQVTALQMHAVLQVFQPYRRLLPRRGGAQIKTGTLRDVNALVGYLGPEGGEPYLVVILLNGAYRYDTRERILDLLEENLE
ncbi:MAG: D-alanyl-D-alanine carboxypeptidase [Thermodesulfobacteriota bacterium]